MKNASESRMNLWIATALGAPPAIYVLYYYLPTIAVWLSQHIRIVWN
jgi:hypothetical protein